MRIFLSLLIAAASVATAAERKPNVVIFLTDDQGWGDLSVSGNTNLATPNIDSLAKDGASLENFYVCQVCSPTRAEFLTGRYYPRTGVSGVSRGEERLNPDETTIADLLKANGYATGAFGKWHNGTQSPYHPNDRGFDEYYGFTSGHWGHYFSPPLDHNRTKVRGKGYVVDDFTDHAMAFIEKNADQPFFCYLPYNTPHSPMMIDDNFYEKFKGVDPKMRNRDPEKEEDLMTRAALAMCENIDWNVGRVLKKLDELKLRDDTIVIYFSDNGPNSYRWNGGMKGKKGSIDEGGLRSPFFIRWLGKIEAERKISEIASGIDLLPTLASLTGTLPKTAKPLDGLNLDSLFLGNNSETSDRLIFSIQKKRVSVRGSKFRLDATGMLFDIRNDRGQLTDVSKNHPEETARLKAAALAHQVEMQTYFEKNKARPFTVGFSKLTTLPARDGIPHGTIQRSSKAPNNSFFKNWTSDADSITWDIEVGTTGKYEAILHYTCAGGNVGTTIRLGIDDTGSFAESKVTEAFDPPLYDKSKERVEESHYFVKDFKPLSLGEITLNKGRGILRLTAHGIVGGQAIDVHSVELNQVD